ncbi:E3 binding domain-containing protein [Deinococcus sp. YIM 134068]|uniref:E3 binding domain-containing protein n=1 Tax=Deinococcus lichenicola TaxID=3118910 RepID=UPI002F924B61
MEQIAPLAKILAEANGIDWRTLRGSGEGGLIVEGDVLGHLARIMSGDEEPPPTPVDAPPPDWTGEDLSASLGLGLTAPGLPTADQLRGAGVDSDITAFVAQAQSAPAPAVAPALADDALDFELDDDQAILAPPAPTPVAASAWSAPAPAEPTLPPVPAFTVPEPVRPEPVPVIPTPAAAPAPASSGMSLGLGSLLSSLYKPAAPTPQQISHPQISQPQISQPQTSQPEAAPTQFFQPQPQPVQPAPAPVLPELPAFPTPAAQAPVAQIPVVTEPTPVFQLPETPAAPPAPAPLPSLDFPLPVMETPAPVEVTPALDVAEVEPEVEVAFPTEAAGAVMEEAQPAAVFEAAPEVAEPQPEVPVFEVPVFEVEVEVPEMEVEETVEAVAELPAPAQSQSFGVYLRRDVNARPITDLSRQLASALGREVPLALLVARAASRHAESLGLGTVALHDAETAHPRPVVAGALRDALDALNHPQDLTPDLLVTDAGHLDLDDLHFGHTVTLSLGRVAGDRAALTLCGDLDPTHAARFLADVARELEEPIILVV